MVSLVAIYSPAGATPRLAEPAETGSKVPGQMSAAQETFADQRAPRSGIEPASLALQASAWTTIASGANTGGLGWPAAIVAIQLSRIAPAAADL